jgi:hypothetical protein
MSTMRSATSAHAAWRLRKRIASRSGAMPPAPTKQTFNNSAGERMKGIHFQRIAHPILMAIVALQTFVLGAFVAIAQESGGGGSTPTDVNANIKIDADGAGGAGIFGMWWVWVLIAVFLIVVVALTTRSRGSAD